MEAVRHSSRDIRTTPASTFVDTKVKEEKFQLRILALNWRCLRNPQSGGAEVNLFEQAHHWVNEGHEVTVITSDPGRDHAPDKYEDFVGIKIIRLGNRFTLYLWAALYTLLFSFKYDVILDVSNGIPFFTPLFTWKPVTLMVHHVHGDQWQREFPKAIARFGWFLESRVVPFIYRNKMVITVSPTTEEELHKIGFKSDMIRVIYNGLQIRIPLSRTESPTPRIAYIGRIKAYKRINLLVQAVDQLRKDFPDIHLDIAGTGDGTEQVAALVDKLGLQSHVTIHGYVDEATKAHLLAQATVFATPSMQEGWGLSVIEANAYGCPVVAYNVPGLSASIPNNETGLLAENDEEFIKAIARIINDGDLRHRLSKGAIFWASMFTWEYTALSTISVLAASRDE